MDTKIYKEHVQQSLASLFLVISYTLPPQWVFMQQYEQDDGFSSLATSRSNGESSEGGIATPPGALTIKHTRHPGEQGSTNILRYGEE